MFIDTFANIKYFIIILVIRLLFKLYFAKKLYKHSHVQFKGTNIYCNAFYVNFLNYCNWKKTIIAQGFTKYWCQVMHKTKLTRIEWMFSARNLKKISLYYIMLYPTWSTKALTIRNKVNMCSKAPISLRTIYTAVYSENYVSISHCKYE